VSAYLSPSPATAKGLQSAVAARAALTLAMDPAANNPALLNAAISIAQLQGAQLQEQVAQARERSDIDSAVNLAASGKRLSSLLEQAKKLQGTEVKA